jgi:hypothetical protein
MNVPFGHGFNGLNGRKYRGGTERLRNSPRQLMMQSYGFFGVHIERVKHDPPLNTLPLHVFAEVAGSMAAILFMESFDLAPTHSLNRRHAILDTESSQDVSLYLGPQSFFVILSFPRIKRYAVNLE